MSEEVNIPVVQEQNEQRVPVVNEPFSFNYGHDYTAGNGLVLEDYEFSADTSVLATKEYVNSQVGDIETILAQINSGTGV